VLIALGQFNPVIGDLEGNVVRIGEQIAHARAEGAQLVLFPELAVSGYPPEDLLLRADFLDACREAVDAIARQSRGIVAAFGAPLHGPSDLHNALVLAADGEVRAVYHKVELPHYGVFDEGRYFGPGSGQALVRLGGHLVAITLCADLWIADGPAAAAARAGAELVLNASASPFQVGKHRERETMLFQRARDMVCPIAYCNLWGGQDELVFDGGSLVVDHRGSVVARARQFRDELLICSLNLRAVRAARLRDPRLRAVGAPIPAGPSLAVAPPVLAEIDLAAGGQASAPPPPTLGEPLGPQEELWQALCTGIADYARKNDLEDAMVGLDGGIDSALVALLACDALGADRVCCVVMPSSDCDPLAFADACELARSARCELRVIHTDELDAAYQNVLGPELGDADPPRTRERVRARIRSNVLMALAHSHGWLHLSTGNRSELACGYATLYGETFGGFAAIKDVPRTLVTGLIRWRKSIADASVPDGIVSDEHAGLYSSRWAADGLPAFETVDPILKLYAEDDEDPETIIASGHDPALVRRVVRLVEDAEYKRRQTPPGITISARPFSRGRRMPISHRFEATRPQGALESDARAVPVGSARPAGEDDGDR
jgi:NAD+ synthase (glutamine-hydrolysing)